MVPPRLSAPRLSSGPSHAGSERRGPQRWRAGQRGVLTATRIQKNVTERCGPETESSTFRAMIPPRTAEMPAITSTTWRGRDNTGSWGPPRGSGDTPRFPECTVQTQTPRSRVRWAGPGSNRGGAHLDRPPASPGPAPLCPQLRLFTSLLE